MKIKYLLKGFFFVLSMLFIACNEENAGNTTPDLPDKPIVILYENDVHCAIDGYPFLVSVRNECKSVTDYVSTVSCGDFASGCTTGSEYSEPQGRIISPKP